MEALTFLIKNKITQLLQQKILLTEATQSLINFLIEKSPQGILQELPQM